MSSFLETVQSSRTLDEVREAALSAHHSIQAASDNLNEMLDDAQAMGSNEPPKLSPTAPENLIALAVEAVAASSKVQKHVDVRYNLRHGRMVNADFYRTLRIFSNLLRNAIEAMPARGQIWLETKDVNVLGHPFVEFCVGNSGSYIEPADRERVFELFYTRNKRKGTGLGLAIAEKMVSMHGGRIWCESDKDRGTEFRFTLPSPKAVLYSRVDVQLPAVIGTAGNAQLCEQVTAVDDECAQLDILIVEDDPGYAQSVMHLLDEAAETLGIRVSIDHVATGAEAQRRARLGRPRAVLMDFDLGSEGTSGLEIAGEIRAGGDVGTVYLHSNRRFGVDQSTDGVDAVIPKPLTGAMANAIVAAIVQKSGAGDRGATATSANCTSARVSEEAGNVG